MKCFQISQDGECVALVSDIGLVRAIVECRPRGFYVVTEVEVGRPPSKRKKPSRKPSTKHAGEHRRRKASETPSPWVLSLPGRTIGPPQQHAR